MANVCSCFMEVTGNVQKFREQIKRQDPILKELFPWFIQEQGDAYGLVQDPNDIPDDGDLLLDFTCKWGPPTDELLKLSQAFPECSFKIRYEESGMDVYGTLAYSEGNLTEDNPMEEEDYRDAHDEQYNEIVSDIEECPYDEFLKNLGGMDTLEDSDACMYSGLVEKHYLKRLKDEDLPLLVNHVWLSNNNKKTYEKRLKGEVING
jgi:Ferredoxin-like domain in Api92-like protein